MPLGGGDPGCDRCGYSREGLGGRSCPECGWDARVGGRWSWSRWPRLVRTLWIAGCPFACHGMSMLGEQVADRSVPAGLAASMLAIASLLLLPIDIVSAWGVMHDEPAGLAQRARGGVTLVYAILAVVVCGLMVVAPA
ncbi:MAG: hypothetical protein AAFS11_00085 [Planctomycetota bacterium]